jgi:ubiquinone/menaquinone biosynthesis C-methylase UbiE
LDYAIGFNAVWVIHLGKRYGLFEALASYDGPISPSALAEKTKLFHSAVKAWCSAAVCLGYLDEEDGKLVLPVTTKELVLDEKSSNYVAGQLTYSALRSLEYGSFDELFALGKSRPPSSENTIKAFEAVTSWDHHAFFNTVKTRNKRLHEQLLRGCKILDVGCGAGRFMQRLSAAYPLSETTGIDLYADEITKVVDSRMKIVRSSGETMKFQDEFDLVYLGESLYLMEDKQQAIRNCYRALRKGGTIAILEGLLSEKDGCVTSKECKMVMTMQLDFVLQGHEFMTKSQITNLLRLGGFKKIRFHNLGAAFHLATARKT